MLIRQFVCLAIAISCVAGLPVKEKPKEPEQTGEKPDDSPTQNLEVSFYNFNLMGPFGEKYASFRM